MAQGQVYDIPENAWPWVKKELEKLQKKAAKLTDDKVTFMVIGKNDQPNSQSKLAGSVKIFYEVFISAPEVKLNGWEIVATYDHDLDAGSIIRQVHGHVLPAELLNAPPACEHCGVNRRRNNTFFLKCDETYKQVGRSCLVDFTGHKSPEKLVRAAELYGHIQGIMQVVKNGIVNSQRDLVTTEYAAREVATTILRSGYVSVKESRDNFNLMSSTFVQTRTWWGHACEDWSPAAIDLADKALEWGREIKATSSWQHNVRVIAESPTIEFKHLALLTSLIGVFSNKYFSRNEQSEHQGLLGERIPNTLATLVKTSPAKFGTRHVFKDSKNNIYVWFKDTDEFENMTGMVFEISGKVRQHSIFGGVKQTDLNFMRIKQVD
jgi:hypothetical protein